MYDESSKTKYESFIAALLEIDPAMTLIGAATLLYVSRKQYAKSGTVTPSDIGKELSLSPSMASRVVYYLGEGINSTSVNGLGLMTMQIDATDRRRRTVHLTKSGRDIIRKLNGIMT